MTRHYVLFDTNITNAGIFDETDLGTDLREASKEAEYYANHLTKGEMKRRDEFALKACDIPDDADTDEIIWYDYIADTIADYKEMLDEES